MQFDSTAHSLNEYKTHFSSSSTFLNRVNYSLSLYLCSLKQLLQMFTSILRILEIYKDNKNNVINKNGPQQQSDLTSVYFKLSSTKSYWLISFIFIYLYHVQV